MTPVRIAGEVAHYMALVPLAWLSVQHWRGQKCDVAYWWIAGALGVSWVADTVAHFAGASFVSRMYLVTQAALICAVFASRRTAATIVIALAVVASLSLIFVPLTQKDAGLHLVACGCVLFCTREASLGMMRTAMWTYFGGFLVGWLLFGLDPSFASWALMQTCRAVGISLFVHAIDCQTPVLRVMRKAA